mmetsp:Transcript_42248/g.88037  ORF Transcript_42248/g.88037 Transcript_42248/m.88037 type:complete len:239 (+) Transcript_42248:127-843(+)
MLDRRRKMVVVVNVQCAAMSQTLRMPVESPVGSTASHRIAPHAFGSIVCSRDSDPRVVSFDRGRLPLPFDATRFDSVRFRLVVSSAKTNTAGTPGRSRVRRLWPCCLRAFLHAGLQRRGRYQKIVEGPRRVLERREDGELRDRHPPQLPPDALADGDVALAPVAREVVHLVLGHVDGQVFHDGGRRIRRGVVLVAAAAAAAATPAARRAAPKLRPTGDACRCRSPQRHGAHRASPWPW